jgi:hypothetical protein
LPRLLILQHAQNQVLEENPPEVSDYLKIFAQQINMIHEFHVLKSMARQVRTQEIKLDWKRGQKEKGRNKMYINFFSKSTRQAIIQ